MIDNVKERNFFFRKLEKYFCGLYWVDAFQLNGNGVKLMALKKAYKGTSKLVAAKRTAGIEKH